MMITKLFDKTFWKFIMVGLVNTGVGAFVMFLLYNYFHFGYWFSSIANYVVGSILSYFLNKNITFQNERKDYRIVIKFVINISACYIVAYGLAKPLVRYLLRDADIGFRDNMAMLLGMGLFVLVNYLGQRFIVFKKK